jgi:hypothetical protein
LGIDLLELVELKGLIHRVIIEVDGLKDKLIIGITSERIFDCPII